MKRILSITTEKGELCIRRYILFGFFHTKKLSQPALNNVVVGGFFILKRTIALDSYNNMYWGIRSRIEFESSDLIYHRLTRDTK